MRRNLAFFFFTKKRRAIAPSVNHKLDQTLAVQILNEIDMQMLVVGQHGVHVQTDIVTARFTHYIIIRQHVGIHLFPNKP